MGLCVSWVCENVNLNFFARVPSLPHNEKTSGKTLCPQDATHLLATNLQTEKHNVELRDGWLENLGKEMDKKDSQTRCVCSGFVVFLCVNPCLSSVIPVACCLAHSWSFLEVHLRNMVVGSGVVVIEWVQERQGPHQNTRADDAGIRARVQSCARDS